MLCIWNIYSYIKLGRNPGGYQTPTPVSRGEGGVYVYTRFIIYDIIIYAVYARLFECSAVLSHQNDGNFYSYKTSLFNLITKIRNIILYV